MSFPTAERAGELDRHALERAVERGRRRAAIQGDVPNTAAPPAGCRFNTRCPLAFDRCFVEKPPLAAVAGGAPGGVLPRRGNGGWVPDVEGLRVPPAAPVQAGPGAVEVG